MTNPSTFTPDIVLVRCDQFLGNQVEQELVMIDIESGRYFGLNSVAADIWERLATPVSIADLCADLQQRYEVDAARCDRDVVSLLLQMRANDMVRIVKEPV